MDESEIPRLSRIRHNLERRALICDVTRSFFRSQGFLEVETPVRMPTIAPEQHIIPLESMGWFLSTSPELHMKRLLASGYDKLFQMSRCFRKGERGRWHNPEFTMLEWYRTGGEYRQMINDTELLVTTVARELGFGDIISYRGQKIDLALPWQSITVRDAFMKHAGWNPVVDPDPVRFDDDLVLKVIPAFPPDRPLVLMDYPAPMASLARLKPDEPDVAERAEVFIGGLELANAYSELRDAAEQRKRFQLESAEIEKREGKKRPVPERFLEALARLPDCGGIALGMDRLVMLFCDADAVDEVIAFTDEWA